ncbi:response regulator [Roseibacterium sp. SDUM158016]|uniref:response regulator n=1 Tax=Roseicyclus sediminis TaxID=2980997 RepID=UPI0021CE95D6|nr:response regulator [Roseibacterium sp. SDUM158016]MCU4654960.1 response regulator [Roseibacterium sp. SDUM158016]
MRDGAEPEESKTVGRDAADGAATLSDTLQFFSHDIRAAVSDVVGGLRLIDEARLDADTRAQLDRVRAAGDTLAGMVESALMAASGEIRVIATEEAEAVSSLVETWRRRWAGRAAEGGVGLSIQTEGDLSLRVRAPRLPLERIVCNLIANAVSHGGGAAIRLRVAADAGTGLEVEVADGGRGYPEDIATRPRVAGHGLGLRIAAELSRQIGASLETGNGGPLGGAVACLALPAERLEQGRAEDAEAPGMPDLSDLRILVAEDNLTNQAILSRMLGQMGARTVFASDGAEALEALAAEDFDIALVDIEMPRVSGLEVMRVTRARDDAAAAMPIVALTAYVLRDNREAIYAAGADGIIGKPVASAEEFGRAILRHAGRPAGLPEPEDVLAHGGQDAAFGVKMDEERLDGLLAAAGPDGARELLERLDEDLRSVRDKLEEGVRDSSVPLIREQTHILIAVSGAVGADRLCRLAEVLNIAAKRRRIDDLAALHAPCRRDLDELIALIALRVAARG